MDHDIRVEFLEFIAKSKAPGCNGLSEDCHYIPRKALDDYWSKDMVTSVISKAGPRVPDGFVARDYRTILSILVYINKLNHISEFVRRQLDDSNLPFHSPEWPYEINDPRNKFNDTIQQFYDNQWSFCPLDLSRDSVIHKRVLHPRHILPFAEKRRAKSTFSGNSMGYEVVVDNVYQAAEEVKGPEIFALKVFNSDQKQAFEDETNALAALAKVPSDHMVRYYGSFIQGDTYNILLEYADGGTLSDFLKETAPPVRQEDIASCWESIFGLVSALEKVHNISNRNANWSLKGLHADIRPDNILWFKKNDVSKDPCFKIADFGLRNVQPAPPRNIKGSNTTYTKIGTASTNIYTPPEAAGDWREQLGHSHQSGPNCGDRRLSPTNDQRNIGYDIWSLGCLFLECLTWLESGYQEVERFRQSRRDELTKKAIKYDDRWPAFHDGAKLLPTVEGIFDNLRSQLEGREKGDGDKLTQKILDMLRNEVLVPQDNGRFRAKDMLKVFRSEDTETDGYAMAQNDWGLDVKTGPEWKKEERMRWGYSVRTASLRGY
ncbi:kinase-like domain-containing protein [Rhypophila decipiens]|uniref:Kinase-like domain-containing protein n=1 Tax=Rhypophila decipiens TaxID=261697 RepID=A0AAN6Y7D2_9PEZI|nr:kinase-like domain-containing protein [Rhypophila decipiens]